MLVHWGPAAGPTDSLVVAAVKLAEVVQKGEVVVLLKLRLYASTLEQLEGVRKAVERGGGLGLTGRQ